MQGETSPIVLNHKVVEYFYYFSGNPYNLQTCFYCQTCVLHSTPWYRDFLFNPNFMLGIIYIEVFGLLPWLFNCES